MSERLLLGRQLLLQHRLRGNRDLRGHVQHGNVRVSDHDLRPQQLLGQQRRRSEHLQRRRLSDARRRRLRDASDLHRRGGLSHLQLQS